MKTYYLTIKRAFGDPNVNFYMFFDSYSRLSKYLERVINLFPDCEFVIETIKY